MKGLLDKIRWGRALGVYVAQDRLVLTEVSGGVGGAAVVHRGRYDFGPEGPGEALKRLIEERLNPRQRRRVTVCIGLGAERTFFASRRYVGEGDKQNPTSDQLLSAGGAVGVPDVGGALADHVPARALGKHVYTVAACRRELAEQLRQALASCGVRNYRLEPAPWNLLEAVDGQHKAGKKWKLAIHVFLEPPPAAMNQAGDAEPPPASPSAPAPEGSPQEARPPEPAPIGGLAMLTAENQPVLWRRFTSPTGQEAVGVASAARSVQVHAAVTLGIQNVGGIILHGRVGDELAQRVIDESGLEAVQGGGEWLSDEIYSLGLALSAHKSPNAGGGGQGSHKKSVQPLDLLRSMRPPPGLKEMFPAKQAAIVALAGLGMVVALWDKSANLAGQCEQLRRQNASHKWAANLRTPAISGQKKRLSEGVGAVCQFLATRILWGDYFRDLPTRLPPNACLTNISAACEMKEIGKKEETARKTNKSLTLRGVARYAGGSSEESAEGEGGTKRDPGAPPLRLESTAAPKEIDAFLESLRQVELLQRDFPLVSLADIKWKHEGAGDLATFTIVALPKKTGGGKAEDPK